MKCKNTGEKNNKTQKPKPKRDIIKELLNRVI